MPDMIRRYFEHLEDLKDQLSHLKSSGSFDLIYDGNDEFWILKDDVPIWNSQDLLKDDTVEAWNEKVPGDKITYDWLDNKMRNLDNMPRYEMMEFNSEVAEEILKVAKDLTAAEEIPFEELPEDRKKLLNRLIGGSAHRKVEAVFYGIHRYIAVISGIAARFNKKDITLLAKDSNVRWIDGSSVGISIGF